MFNSELIKIIEDTEIQEYFKIKKVSIYDFVKKYIKIDKMLNASDFEGNAVYNKLDEIHKNIISKIECANNDNKSVEEIKKSFNLLTCKINNDIDRQSLCILKDIKDTLDVSIDRNPKLVKIEQTLESMNQNFTSNSAKKGQISETILFNILRDSLPDTEIVDTSSKPNSGDIHLIKDNHPTILIDSKNFGNNTVPKRDIDKFYQDIQQNNCSGILCNSFGGIANKQHFEIDIIDNNVIIFLHSHKFDDTTFKLAISIIYNMTSKLKTEDANNIHLNNTTFQNLKIEYNYYIQSFRHHLDIIKSNVNSLSQLSFSLLDNFFKRKASIKCEKKPFTCHICAVEVSTEKILKTHIKKKHSDIHF